MNEMTQEEKWFKQWKEIMDFMTVNKRRPSKYEDSERGMRNWWKQQQKLVNAGALKPERMELFNRLLEMGDRYRHVNQYK